MNWNQELDTNGLLCPLPVLKARKNLSLLQPGQVLRLLADDPMAAIDVPHYCTSAGHILLEQSEADGKLFFLIKRA
ncbi:MAG: sulfurtransferase TusA family protein [Paracoccaceae bacterium]|jgi:tRNA 2-thiouridine synthesizing protein A